MIKRDGLRKKSVDKVKESNKVTETKMESEKQLIGDE